MYKLFYLNVAVIVSFCFVCVCLIAAFTFMYRSNKPYSDVETGISKQSFNRLQPKIVVKNQTLQKNTNQDTNDRSYDNLKNFFEQDDFIVKTKVKPLLRILCKSKSNERNLLIESEDRKLNEGDKKRDFNNRSIINGNSRIRNNRRGVTGHSRNDIPLVRKDDPVTGDDSLLQGVESEQFINTLNPNNKRDDSKRKKSNNIRFEHTKFQKTVDGYLGAESLTKEEKRKIIDEHKICETFIEATEKFIRERIICLRENTGILEKENIDDLISSGELYYIYSPVRVINNISVILPDFFPLYKRNQTIFEQSMHTLESKASYLSSVCENIDDNIKDLFILGSYVNEHLVIDLLFYKFFGSLNVKICMYLIYHNDICIGFVNIKYKGVE